jgi:hypothetical protein
MIVARQSRASSGVHARAQVTPQAGSGRDEAGNPLEVL